LFIFNEVVEIVFDRFAIYPVRVIGYVIEKKVYDVSVVCTACSGAESFKGEVALVAV